MDNERSNRLTDEQLDAILNEAGNWVVNGQAGQAFCVAASLRMAIGMAETYAASDAVVVAICQLPSDNIIVFPEQIERLRRVIAVREVVPDEHMFTATIPHPALRTS
jgi:hypothetical protein